MKFKRALMMCLPATALAASAASDEGMWLPHQMKLLNLRSKGLFMNPADMVRRDGTGLMNAVVNPGGGTGEFVSAEGLILTDHHAAFGALQRAATKDMDYIRDGFVAWNRQLETQPASPDLPPLRPGSRRRTAAMILSLKASPRRNRTREIAPTMTAGQ